jgi:uncharacterized protein YdaU (DUF1376 family)
MCLLTVDGITRRDVGQGKGKALFSDAFKRAAVKFGVGVSLYALPQTWLRVDDGHLRAAGQGKEKLFLQPAGIEHLRSLYAIWLGTAQGASFGEPLSHGDAAEGSVGDPLDPDAEHEQAVPGARVVVAPQVRATYDMSHECCGMYMALLIALWENDGQISSNEDDLRMICRASRQEWDRHKLKLSRLFYVGDGCWMHNGIREQLARAKKVSEARSESSTNVSGSTTRKYRRLISCCPCCGSMISPVKFLSSPLITLILSPT